MITFSFIGISASLIPSYQPKWFISVNDDLPVRFASSQDPDPPLSKLCENVFAEVKKKAHLLSFPFMHNFFILVKDKIE